MSTVDGRVLHSLSHRLLGCGRVCLGCVPVRTPAPRSALQQVQLQGLQELVHVEDASEAHVWLVQLDHMSDVVVEQQLLVQSENMLTARQLLTRVRGFKLCCV